MNISSLYIFFYLSCKNSLLLLSLKIRGDFILVSGDTVSNMSLTEALREHKDRRRKDSNAIMTMVVKQSKPSPVTHQSRLGTDELFMTIDPETKQLLYYEDKSDKSTMSLDKALLSDHPSMYLHNDKQVFPISCFLFAIPFCIILQKLLTVFVIGWKCIVSLLYYYYLCDGIRIPCHPIM